jgi:putative solute:sodium symporter small subunit
MSIDVPTIPLANVLPVKVDASGTPQHSYWLRAQFVTGVLFTAWLATTLGIIFFARELAQLTIFGWPFSYYLAAQGSMLIYLAIVGIYALVMRRLDRLYWREVDHSSNLAYSSHVVKDASDALAAKSAEGTNDGE